MTGQQLLVTYLKPQGRRVALLAVLMAVGIALTLLNPQIVRFFIDHALSAGADGPLVGAALLFLGVAVARQAVLLATDYVGEWIAWQSTNALRADLALHCLRLDLSFHKVHAPGELIERIDGDVSMLANFLSRFSVQVVGNALLVLGVLLALFAADWRVGAGISLYVSMAFLLLWRVQRLGVDRWAATRQADAEFSSFLEERLHGGEDIRSAGAEAYTLQRLQRLMQTMLLRYRHARLISNFTFVLANGAHTLAYALGLGIGAWLYLNGQASIGTAYLIVNYVALLAVPLNEIRGQVQDLQRASASTGRVAALLAEQPSVREAPRATLPAGPLSVAFEDVTFRYEDEGASSSTVALDGVTLSLAPGDVLGVLGRTGSGKSTLSRVLFRLYDPQGGVIRVGGRDIRDVALGDLRERVALVTQDVQLFAAPIRDNVTLFNPRISDAQIEAALRALGVWEWVQARASGLDALLAPGGQGMSAGEAQLLAFARAFLKDPGLVVLDEASSRLDPATEQLLERAVSQLLRGRTGIIIAHRLGTLQRATHVALFEQGRVVEHGPRAALAADPGSRFHHLLQAGLEQALDDGEGDDATTAQPVEPEGVAV
jgi:ABC-type multidrug transport system fused ATPase/permease subunit